MSYNIGGLVFTFEELDAIAKRAARRATWGRSQDYHDAKQDAFLLLLTNRFKIDLAQSRSSCVAYLVKRISYNLIRARQNATGARLKTPLSFIPITSGELVELEDKDPAEIAEAREERRKELDAIRAALATFQPLERAALLAYLRGEKPLIISKTFDIKRNYTYSLIRRFKKRLEKSDAAGNL